VGGSSRWTVHWLVRRVPATVEAVPGSASLLSWVRSLAANIAPR
jgi:hypothetical protein